jgi:hypothetical protein
VILILATDKHGETRINTEGMASPTYYCNRNTHMLKEKSWNENKVSEWSSTEEFNKSTIK